MQREKIYSCSVALYVFVGCFIIRDVYYWIIYGLRTIKAVFEAWYYMQL